MADINLKTLTPDTSLPTTGFLFGADSQASTNPSVYGVTTAITAILGNAASSDALVFNSDTTFSRKAAANFRFGAADAASPIAQTLSVQSIVGGLTGTPNLSAAAYPFTITGAQGTGTGAGGSIVFQVAPAGGSGSAQNTLVAALTITGERSFQFRGAASSSLTFAGEAIYAMNTAGTQNLAMLSQYGIRAAADVPIGFSNSTSSVGTQDVFLYRDAANILALKNSTNAQEFRVYETTTGPIYKALLGNRQLMKISGASFTDGAGSSAGTMTNAPAAGNPTKWIPIDDNGTTRYIPAW